VPRGNLLCFPSSEAESGKGGGIAAETMSFVKGGSVVATGRTPTLVTAVKTKESSYSSNRVSSASDRLALGGQVCNYENGI
jgi:hypothetical protein